MECRNPFDLASNVVPNSTNRFRSSDLDLYVRANSPSESWAITKELMESLNPSGVVVRTKYAISFYSDMDNFPSATATIRSTLGDGGKHFIKVQIINRVIPKTDSITDDLYHLFETFDMDCCKWACDGERFYTTDRAKDAYTSRICHVPWSRLTDSSVVRMARYYSRCYDFEIEEYDSRRVVFPQAVQKIAEIVRSRNVPADLPVGHHQRLARPFVNTRNIIDEFSIPCHS